MRLPLSTNFTRNKQLQLNPTGRPKRYRRPNLPVLFYNIIGQNWTIALRRARSHPHEIYTVEDTSGDTPLHFACRLDPPVEIVKSLLPLCCNEKNREGATALHVAASHRCSAEVIETMVDKRYINMKSSNSAATATSNDNCQGRSLTLSLTNRGRTPVHYACVSFRGLSIEAFRVLFEATIEACVKLEETEKKDINLNQDLNSGLEWEGDVLLAENKEKFDAFSMQDHFGYTPLSLLFQKYKQRVKHFIRVLESLSRPLPSSLAAASVQEEFGSLWLKARLIVCLMAEKKKSDKGRGHNHVDFSDDPVALEAAKWASQRHQSHNEYDNDEEEDDLGARTFRLVHASVALAGYGCPGEMIRLAMSVYPNQVREMDEDGNLPLHIAAVASSFIQGDNNSTPASTSDEDSLISSLSSISGLTCDTTKPFEKVIRMLLRSYPEAAQIPHGQSGRLPLILAMDAGQRTMNDGMRLLLEVYPAALETKEFDPKLYPYLMAIIGKPREVKVNGRHHVSGRFPLFGKKKKDVYKKAFPTALFEALRAKPNLLLNDTKY